MSTSTCKAKNPATCRYHGKISSSNSYQQSLQLLEKAKTLKLEAKDIGQYAVAEKAFAEAIVKIDSTDKGYLLLKEDYNRTSNFDTITKTQLKKRIKEALSVRGAASTHNPNSDAFKVSQAEAEKIKAKADIYNSVEVRDKYLFVDAGDTTDPIVGKHGFGYLYEKDSGKFLTKVPFMPYDANTRTKMRDLVEAFLNHKPSI